MSIKALWLRVVILVLILCKFHFAARVSLSATIEPTSIPSSSIPSSTPTPIPTISTSKPTVVGATNCPSSNPTSIPTFYSGSYRNNTLSYAIFKNALERTQQQYAMTYSYFSYKDRVMEGSCNGTSHIYDIL